MTPLRVDKILHTLTLADVHPPNIELWGPQGQVVVLCQSGRLTVAGGCRGGVQNFVHQPYLYTPIHALLLKHRNAEP